MSSRIKALTHPQRVCLLYKSILRLHRGLPEQMQIMGDAYVKDEFRRNKTADHVQTITFMEAWAVRILIIYVGKTSKTICKGVFFLILTIFFIVEICLNHI